MEHVAEFGWTLLPHPLYSPDLVPSNFHLFSLIKNGLCNQHLPDSDAIIAAVRKWVASAGSDFNDGNMKALVHC
jgi:hypothetical protein